MIISHAGTPNPLLTILPGGRVEVVEWLRCKGLTLLASVSFVKVMVETVQSFVMVLRELSAKPTYPSF